MKHTNQEQYSLLALQQQKLSTASIGLRTTAGPPHRYIKISKSFNSCFYLLAEREVLSDMILWKTEKKKEP